MRRSHPSALFDQPFSRRYALSVETAPSRARARVAIRSRGGRTDGREGHQRHRPKPWCSHRRSSRPVPAQAEALAVAQTAVMGISGTGRSRSARLLGTVVVALALDQPSRSRGGCMDGRNGQSQHWPKPWWCCRWRVAMTLGPREPAEVGVPAKPTDQPVIDCCLAVNLDLPQPAEVVVVVRLASDCQCCCSPRSQPRPPPATRSRGGCTDGRNGQSRYRPKSWWLGRRPSAEVAAQAEAVVVEQMAVISGRGTGRSRGGWMDGCYGQSRHRLKSW